MAVTQYYQKALAERGYKADAAQQLAIARLQKFSDELVAYDKSQRSVLRRWFSKEMPLKASIYGVG